MNSVYCLQSLDGKDNKLRKILILDNPDVLCVLSVNSIGFKYILSHVLFLHCSLANTMRIGMIYSNYVEQRIFYYRRLGRSYGDIADCLAKIGLKTMKAISSTI